MPIRLFVPALCVVLLAGASRPPTVDLTGYRPQPGLEATLEEEALALSWDGERQQQCLARFTILDGVPTVRELAVRKEGGDWITLGRVRFPNSASRPGCGAPGMVSRSRIAGTCSGMPPEPPRGGTPICCLL